MRQHDSDQTNDVLTALKRIEELLLVIAKTGLAERLSEIFEDKQHRFIFENVGRLPVKILAKKSGLSAGTISNLWRHWEQSGLLVKDGKQYRRVI